ncbi:hypothetical protein Glove_275g24 [Diversispora epigaea]|uniref:Protein kinase domain-containing protein n=1 Tax=Diversispora epigaea TaxID=1348612 RepID=A0A397IB90_9GLOM|nr:hypothetical protein Glove_275g24 [Diversispora epigaea]
MSQGKTNEKELETWMDNLIIEDIIQKENIPFNQYSEFQNVKLITTNIFKATFKISQKTVALKNVYLNDNDKFALDDLIIEIKRHRKLEIHNSILKFYGITKQENTNNYMIILEFINEGSLRQYLKINFQKMNWSAKLNLAKQIANVLMFLHSNDVIHGKFNSENILVHNGNIKLNDFGLTKVMSDSLRFFTNNLDPIQYMDSQHLELFSTIGKNKSSDIFGLGIILWEISSGNFPFEMESYSNVDLLNYIEKGEREMAIPGTPQKYKEIYIDCWKHNGNSRPDISQVVKLLSEIIISDASVKFETPHSQLYNAINVKLENLNMQNEDSEIKLDPPCVDVKTEVNDFINDLFECLIDISKKQVRKVQPIMIKKYIRDHKKNPVKILYEMIRHPSYYLYTSLIGFFYQQGIGTVVDNQMAFKFFNLAANEIDMKNISSNLSIRKFYNINKEMGNIYLAHMYLLGIGIEKDLKKGFQIYSKFAGEGSHRALNCMGYCYGMGFGVEKYEKKALELYFKSAKKGNLVALSNVGFCYDNGVGVATDETKAFQCRIKSALSGNIDTMHDVGCCYESGIGVDKDEKEAFKWYLKAAEKGHPIGQHNLGYYYELGYGINRDEVKAFEWYKKAAENDHADSQYVLGKCFYEGYGTKKDIIKAIYWLTKAKESENTSVNELLEEIINIMP